MMLLVRMYVFKTDCLSLDNQPLTCSSLVKTTPLTPSFFFPVVFSAGLRPCGTFMVHLAVTIGVTLVWLLWAAMLVRRHGFSF